MSLVRNPLADADRGSDSGAELRGDDWLFDTLVGLRFGQVVSRHWGHRLEADVSTGGTDYTWSVAPALRYVWGQADRCEVGVGYRHMVIDLANAGDLEPKETLSCPVVSFRFSF